MQITKDGGHKPLQARCCLGPHRLASNREPLVRDIALAERELGLNG